MSRYRRRTTLLKYRRLFAVSTIACLAVMNPVERACGRQSCPGSKEAEKIAIDFRQYFDSEGLSENENEYAEDDLTQLAGCVVDDSDGLDALSNRSFSIRVRSDRRWDSSKNEGDVPSTGSPVRSYVRLRTSTDRSSISVSLQKDAYEPFKWNPGTGWYGYDHIAGYANWHSRDDAVSIVVGDYTVAFGQGLVLSQPFGSRISSHAPWRVLRSKTGAKGYSGSYEAFAFRGVAFGIRPAEGYSIDVFYSRRRFDARPVDETSSVGITDEVPRYKLSSSGIHVSADQVRYRNLITSQSTGAAVSGTFAWMRLGALLSLSRFGAPLILPGSSTARRSTLDGSLFWKLTGEEFSLAGEVAAYRLSDVGLVVGATLRPARQLDLAILYRRYPSGGSGLRGQPFGLRRSLGPQNGLYLSWTVRQRKKWSVSASLDLVAGSGTGADVAFPTTYRDVRFTFTLSPGEYFQVLSQLKFRSRETAGKRLDFTGSTLRSIDLEYFRQWSIQVIYSGHGLTLRTRFDVNANEKRYQAPSTGFHAYQAVSIRLSNGLEVVLHHAFFDAESYENRFWVYEKDVTGKLSVPVLTASGFRSAVMITSRLGKTVKIELKYVSMSNVSRYQKIKSAEFRSGRRLLRSFTAQLSVDI